jgi:hypothetical protein
MRRFSSSLSSAAIEVAVCSQYSLEVIASPFINYDDEVSFVHPTASFCEAKRGGVPTLSTFGRMAGLLFMRIGAVYYQY